MNLAVHPRISPYEPDTGVSGVTRFLTLRHEVLDRESFRLSVGSDIAV